MLKSPNLEMGSLGGNWVWMRSWVWGPQARLKKGGERPELSPHCMRSPWKGSWKPASQEAGSHWALSHGALILDLPASRTGRNKCLLFKPPGLRYFVKAACINQDGSSYDWDGEKAPSVLFSPSHHVRVFFWKGAGLLNFVLLFLLIGSLIKTVAP